MGSPATGRSPDHRKGSDLPPLVTATARARCEGPSSSPRISRLAAERCGMISLSFGHRRLCHSARGQSPQRPSEAGSNAAFQTEVQA